MARSGAEPLPEAQRDFLREAHYAVVTTLRADGSPHATVVWVDGDRDHVLFNITTTRAKYRHIRRDPRVSVAVVDRDDPYRWLSVSGVAEMTERGAEEHIHHLSRKYFGRDYAVRPGEQRVLVRVLPEHITSYRV